MSGHWQAVTELDDTAFEEADGQLTPTALLVRGAAITMAEDELRAKGATAMFTHTFTKHDPPLTGGRLLSTGKPR